MRLSIGIEGMGGVIEDLARLDDRIREEVKDAVDDSARNILAEAKTRVPVKTGTLRDSLEVRKSKSGLTAWVGAKKPGSKYAHLVEFGTVKAPAKPFLHPALESEKPRFVEKIQKIVRG